MTRFKVSYSRYAISTASVALLACLSQPASAADIAILQAEPAEPSDANSESDRVSNPEEIVITGTRTIGGGLMKTQFAPEAISSITPAAIEQEMLAASPLQIVSTIPGVNFGSSDSYGLSVRNFLSVRGLDQTELGYLVEGIPGVDLTSYFPFTETYADNENIADITLTAGNSRLQDPIINASGGEFIVSVKNPDKAMGGRVSLSAGSFNGQRGFLRLDSGLIGNTGVSAFASYSRTEANNYIGPGRNKRDHIDFKARKEWSEDSSTSLFVNYTNFSNARIPILTLAQFNAADASGDFSVLRYSRSFVPGVTTNYFKSFVFPRRSVFSSLTNDFRLTDRISLHVTPYFKYSHAVSTGFVNLNPASLFNGTSRVTPAFATSDLQNGRLFGTNGQIATQYQYGANAFIEWDISDSNHLMFGYWHDNWTDRALASVSLLDRNGEVAGFGEEFALRSTTGEIISGSNFKIKTDTSQFFVGDTQAFFNNRLKISIGAKYLIYKASATNFAPGPQGQFGAKVDRIMPRASFSFEINPTMQVYGNITTNSRMPLTTSSYVNVYNISTGALTNVGNPSTKPEYSIGEQLGFRYYGLFNFDSNLFHMKLKDLQITSLAVFSGVQLPQVVSAGTETIWGASAEVSTRRYSGFSIYANGQYLRATIDRNLPVGADFLPTAGKTMVRSPKWITNAGVNFDKGPVYANATFKSVSSQFSTFMNDQKMPGYQTLDFAIGYRFDSTDLLEKPTFSLNLNNLTAGKYISSIAGVQGTAVPTRGVNGALIAAGTPIYYIAAPFTAMLAFTTGF
jgi:iron complex outermembrane receptor protein